MSAYSNLTRRPAEISEERTSHQVEDAKYILTTIFLMMQITGDLEVFYHPLVTKEWIKKRSVSDRAQILKGFSGLCCMLIANGNVCSIPMSCLKTL